MSVVEPAGGEQILPRTTKTPKSPNKRLVNRDLKFNTPTNRVDRSGTRFDVATPFNQERLSVLFFRSHGVTPLVKDVQKLSIESGSHAKICFPSTEKKERCLLRITRSQDTFAKHHRLQGPHQNADSCGGGCLVYLSAWYNYSTGVKSSNLSLLYLRTLFIFLSQSPN